MNQGSLPNDPAHPVPGVLTGDSATITSPTTPIDAKTFRPLEGSAILDESELGPAPAIAYPDDHEVSDDLVGVARKQQGKAMDLGALEASP
jgi:hypothetical protein